MASLATMKHGARALVLGSGIGGSLGRGALALGAGYGMGQLYGRYRDKWYGEHMPKALAGVGKLGGALLAKSHPLVGGAMEILGQSGLTVLGLEYGVKHGRKAANLQAVLIPASDKAPAGALPITRLGALPAAPGGETISLAELEELRAMS